MDGLEKMIVFRVQNICFPAWLSAVALVVCVVMASSANAAEVPYEIVKKASLKSGDPAPAPKGAAVLIVLGATRGGGKPLPFDLAGLEQLGTVTFRSRNIWYPKPVTYEGVLGSVLLDFVGVPPGKTHLKLRALNEYVARIPIEDFRKWPVLFALKLDGGYMPVREKGPVWVVYPNHLHPELGEGLYQDRWVWQLKEMSFEP